ncbi:GtrA family protein [Luteibacter sp. 3190]|uniref:GtrA family protein n=1 Tax=Luteibacter sp. 3190 TaxID=2817736 RepID=UPI00286204FF|nr:GtrA family protein [Luteibacter sp. 3190]MDR6935263.1 putative flippase GtrA [Luteibacter sp. 3190]
MIHLRREVALFAIGGVLGLCVDAGIAQALVGLAGWNVYTARVVSFLSAATVTWWWNRTHTFAHRDSGRGRHAEWLHWMGLMALGAVVNNGVYVLAFRAFPELHTWPAVAVAAGSAAGSIANFALARAVLFRAPKSSS